MQHRTRLVLSTSYPTAPGETAGHFVEAEVQAARANGETVLVVAAGGASPHQDGDTHYLGGGELFAEPGALVRLRESPRRAVVLARVAGRFWRLARRLPPFDLIEAHWLLPCAWPALLVVRGPKEAVLHGSDVRLLLHLPSLLRTAVARQLARSHVQLRFVSVALREELLRGASWPVDLQAYFRAGRVLAARLTVPPDLDQRSARQQLGIAPAETLVVLCSRLIAPKRVETALTAATLMPGGRIVVLGDGPQRGELERAFPQAQFLGGVERAQALRWLAAADVLIHASRLEGAPSVVREARLLGTPVVACPAGDVARWAEQDADLWCVGEALV